MSVTGTPVYSAFSGTYVPNTPSYIQSPIVSLEQEISTPRLAGPTPISSDCDGSTAASGSQVTAPQGTAANPLQGSLRRVLGHTNYDTSPASIQARLAAQGKAQFIFASPDINVSTTH